jgi:hypothetical protein
MCDSVLRHADSGHTEKPRLDSRCLENGQFRDGPSTSRQCWVAWKGAIPVVGRPDALSVLLEQYVVSRPGSRGAGSRAAVALVVYRSTTPAW